MTLRIYNTLSRALEEFSPIEPGQVRMYVCGVTVYDRPHIGNIRSAVAFDVVRRWLEASGLRVNFVRNITALMYADYDTVGVLRPTHDPRATDFIPQMVEIVQLLEGRNLAYRADNGD